MSVNEYKSFEEFLEEYIEVNIKMNNWGDEDVF